MIFVDHENCRIQLLVAVTFRKLKIQKCRLLN